MKNPSFRRACRSQEGILQQTPTLDKTEITSRPIVSSSSRSNMKIMRWVWS